MRKQDVIAAAAVIRVLVNVDDRLDVHSEKRNLRGEQRGSGVPQKIAAGEMAGRHALEFPVSRFIFKVQVVELCAPSLPSFSPRFFLGTPMPRRSNSTAT